MDKTNFELSPYEIDLLCNSLNAYLHFADYLASFLDCEEPSRAHDELCALCDRLCEVRYVNDRTNCGYYSLEIVKKWHDQTD